MFFSKNKENKLIGLDIGASSIKLSVLSKAKTDYVLEGVSVAPIPRSCVLDGEIFNIDAVTKILRGMVNAGNFQGLKTYSGVSGSGIVVKRIVLPLMSEEELDYHIKWEAEQYIPFPIESVNIDYDIVMKGESKMVVVVVAAKKSLVSSHSAVVNASGLVMGGIDLSSFALYEMFKQNYEVTEKESEIILDIGSSKTMLTIVENGLIVSVKEVESAGDFWTIQIQSLLNLTFEEGEILKQNQDGTMPKEVEKVLESEITKLAYEIKQMIDIYEETSAKKISEISVTGGSTRIPWLRQALEATINIPVNTINPLKSIVFDKRVFQLSYLTDVLPFLGISVGLAIRGHRYD